MPTIPEHISDDGLKLIKESEGFKSRLYNCPAGHCSIGYGHLVHKGPITGDASEAPFKNGISEAWATLLLHADVAWVEHEIHSQVKVDLNQHQFDAVGDFVFNIGSGNFEHSTLLTDLNTDRFPRVPDEFRKWINGGGKVLPGLVKRREAEVQEFES
jgi:lysozyme